MLAISSLVPRPILNPAFLSRKFTFFGLRLISCAKRFHLHFKSKQRCRGYINLSWIEYVYQSSGFLKKIFPNNIAQLLQDTSACSKRSPGMSSIPGAF